MSSNNPLKVGMIGGGGGAFIANPHQKAIHFDGTRKVHSVALHSDPKMAMDEAAAWPYPVKGYESYDAMIAAQKDLPKEERLDYILVVTPNFVHFDPVMKALDAGIPVVCEKPLTIDFDQAKQIVAKVKKPMCRSQWRIRILAIGAVGSVVGSSRAVCWAMCAGSIRITCKAGSRAS